MKTKLIFLAILCFNLSFGQSLINQSLGPAQNGFTSPTGLGAQFGSEIFRFRAGLVTQLDSGSAFNFTSSQWFAQGRLTAGTQTFYGLRFQQPNKSLLMGYSSASPLNPVIQWIGTGVDLGNLEFRVANTFGSTGTPGADVLVATMTKEGNTAFGPLLGISSTSTSKVSISSTTTNNILTNTALLVSCTNGVQNSNGLLAFASGGTKSNVAVQGVVTIGSTANFGAGIYGETETTITNHWAGYFDGPVFATGGYNPSDIKLKNNVKAEKSALEKLSQLKPVTYNYNEIKELNLPKEMQHGFVAQELANVFPELTTDVSKPVFDKERKSTEFFDFKSVNYTGLISVLTAGINELNEELKSLKEEIANLKDNNNSKSKLDKSSDGKGYFMEQNMPNPFSDQTTIRYQLPNGTNNAEIIVFDLNGNLKKSFPINRNQSEITIKSAEIGKGLFIYSLVQSGQEIITKKMIVK